MKKPGDDETTEKVLHADIERIANAAPSSISSVSSESTELPDQNDEQSEKFSRFSPRQKNLFLFILAMAAFQGPLAATSYIPAVANIAGEFHTTGDVINISAAIYALASAFSPCVFNPLFDFYGRKPIFVINLAALCIVNILVAVSQNLVMFFVFRVLTGFFSISFITLAGASCGDIFPPIKRGWALSWCLSGVLAASAIGPVIGGIIITFVSWRILFWVQAAYAGLCLIIGVLFLKETSYELKYSKWKKETGKKIKFIKVNPFSVIMSLRVPTLALVGWTSFTLLFNMYSLLTPIRYVIDPRFNFTTPIQGSLFYLAPGCGMFMSTFFAGRWADYITKRWIRKRNGKFRPEDRLKAVYWIMAMPMPASILVYGWCAEKAKGRDGIMAIIALSMFVNGFAQTFVFASMNTYCIDSLPQLGSTALGSNYFIRYIGTAIGAAAALPEFHSIGIGWSVTISAFLLLTGFASLYVCGQYGHEMREKWLEKMDATSRET